MEGITEVPFTGTIEQENELKAFIKEHKDTPGSLITIMQHAQNIYGYLPIQVQAIIADEVGVPLQEVYGVATFYAFFSLQPKGKYKISVCLGTACYVKGAGQIHNKFLEKLNVKDGQSTGDRKFSVEACRCIGACGLAPVVMINDDVYGRLKMEDIDGILAKYN